MHLGERTEKPRNPREQGRKEGLIAQSLNTDEQREQSKGAKEQRSKGVPGLQCLNSDAGVEGSCTFGVNRPTGNLPTHLGHLFFFTFSNLKKYIFCFGQKQFAEGTFAHLKKKETNWKVPEHLGDRGATWVTLVVEKMLE